MKEVLRLTEGMWADLVKEAGKVYLGAMAQAGAVSKVAWESARQKTESLLNDRVLSAD